MADLDSVTTVTSQGWLSRIFGSIIGVLIGFVLFIAAFPFLFWNEGRAVDTAKALAEGRGAVVVLDSDRPAPANEGHLVHLSGQMTTAENLVDPAVLPQRALKLRRKVEVYQWVEHEHSETVKELGGGTTTKTTYTYTKEWEDSLKDSERFKKPEGHDNPTAKPVADANWTVRQAAIGGFTLGKAVVAELTQEEALPADALARMPEARGRGTIREEWLYRGDPDAPRIGDARITYRYVPLTVASVVARQSGSMLDTYTTHNGHELVMAELGSVSADQMFKEAEKANSVLTWILRAVGTGLMFIALLLMSGPLSVVADLIPFVGDLVGAGMAMLALPIALCLSLITIALAWVAYRPLIGLPLLVLGVAVLAVPIIHRRQKKAAAAAAG